jgi:DNA-directed RNA polymerase subunit RPC12/RpoP
MTSYIHICEGCGKTFAVQRDTQARQLVCPRCGHRYDVSGIPEHPRSPQGTPLIGTGYLSDQAHALLSPGPENDLFITYTRFQTGCAIAMCIGMLVLSVFPLMLAAVLLIDMSTTVELVTFAVAALVGLLLAGFGVRNLRRNIRWLKSPTPELSLLKDGLHDHRGGQFIRWTDMRGFRVEVWRRRGVPNSIKLWIETSASPAALAVELNHLQYDAYTIADLIRERARLAGMPNAHA